MQKPIIAIDVDDTLLDENTAIRLFMNDRYGFGHTAEDYNVVRPFWNYWESIWQLNPEEASASYEAFWTSPYLKDMEPLAGALDALRKLKQKYELVIITSRHHSMVEITQRQLAKHYPAIFGDVHFVALWESGQEATKAKVCKGIGASYLIDDRFEHCQLVTEVGVMALLFGDYGWNRSQKLLPKMIRTKNWAAVLEYFDAKG